jgi:asparagine synthase (glutamine-hydrolysing)
VCGLCGVVAPGSPPETDVVASMAAALDHRGPDGAGAYSEEGVAFGFRRLAIIDLSDAGRQPFTSEDGRLQLVHNGEIYNYRELRAELEAKGRRFRSATDTEVVLSAYEEWGERCVERFNGMWAFALWDGRRRRLFCSRDRFGVKPFYYRLDGGRLVFASELKAFRADPRTSLDANTAVVHDFIEQGWVDHTDQTFLAGIVKLPPAHSLTFDQRGLRLRRYWALEPREPPAGDPAPAVRELVLDAVRLRLRSDVPVGTCLSGGIDSSAITCTVDHLLRTEAENARPVGERQRTFTAYFEDAGFDERPYAEAVVGRTGAEAHWITFTDTELVENLPAIVEAQDEPFGSTSIVAQWYVMREAKRAGVKVMLDGQGADEIFAGYHGYFGPFFADLLRRGRLGDLRRELGAYRSLHGASAATVAAALARPLLPERARRLARARTRGGGALVHADLRGLAGPAARDGAPYRDLLRRQLHLILTRRGLPELLHYEDRNSMAHSLEARVPFLDYRLVELLFSLEARELIARGRTKAVLRRALGDLLPPVVRDRVDKLGFVTPERRWLAGELGELAADVFASRSFTERGFVDARVARRRLERHRAGERPAGFELWRALSLELWARAFLDGPATH